eukprot:7805532-Pyramimonas_sp.AAC.1
MHGACYQGFCSESAVQYGCQRVRSAVVILRGHDTDLHLSPQSGGLVGDEFAVNAFLRAFVPPVQKWLDAHLRFDPQATVLCSRLPTLVDGRLEFSAEHIGCSLTLYADVLTKKLVLPRGAEPRDL